jgi:hypothetical protein
VKIVFTSPYQAEAELIDYGIYVARGVPFNVTDTLGKQLVDGHPHFKLYSEQENKSDPAPAAAPEPESVQE